MTKGDSAGGRHLNRRAVNLGLMAAGAATPACAVEPVRRPAPEIAFRRGIGVRSMFWPDLEPGSRSRYIWPPFQDEDHAMSPTELTLLAELGFDFVRMPMSPHIFLMSDEAQLQDLIRIMHARIEMYQRAGINVIANLHPTYQEEAFSPDRIVNDKSLGRRFRELVRRLARELSVYGPGVALEPQNEPPVPSRARWRQLILSLCEVARSEAPNLPLVVTGHDGGGPRALAEFSPLSPSMGSIIYTYHYYSPGIFTHQTQIDTARHLAGLEWPPDPRARQGHIITSDRLVDADPDLDGAGRARARREARDSIEGYYDAGHNHDRIRAAFGQVGQWADRHGVPRSAILLGEFGVVRTHWIYRGAKETGRLAWLQAVRQAAEERGFGWLVWTYRGWGGMALTDRDTRAFDIGSARALGLNAGAIGRAGA